MMPESLSNFTELLSCGSQLSTKFEMVFMSFSTDLMQHKVFLIASFCLVLVTIFINSCFSDLNLIDCVPIKIIMPVSKNVCQVCMRCQRRFQKFYFLQPKRRFLLLTPQNMMRYIFFITFYSSYSQMRYMIFK